jgi:hypothetical protein
MAEKIISHFPKPVLDDLVAGRWLPIIGAGFSRNAIIPSGKQMPLWEDLGREFADELADYPYSGALDAISAYSHEYGRPRLIERMSAALLVDQARPGEAHRAFCSLLFDIVCTTNFDFLLERQYEMTRRYCRPIIDEDHLAVNARDNATALLKLHGDLHHPTRLVATEEDYDSFLEKYPLLATYLANLLITRTAVLVGYSLDDPDFRQIWQVIGERLGRARRLAYAIMIDARPTDVARFARRGVKVISLPGSRSKYGEILARTFDELREYWRANLIRASYVMEEDPLNEFSLPAEALTRLCFFAIPITLQPFYRDDIFPLVEEHGFVPVTAADVIAPGENYAAKIDAIIKRSIIIIVDASTQNTLFELGLAAAAVSHRQILVIAEEAVPMPPDLEGVTVIHRNKAPFSEQGEFKALVSNWLAQAEAELRPILVEEPLRLLKKGEYRAAVISAMTLLETLLRDKVKDLETFPDRAYSSRQLLQLAVERQIISSSQEKMIRSWYEIRSRVVHSQTAVSRAKANEIVGGVVKLIRSFQS